MWYWKVDVYWNFLVFLRIKWLMFPEAATGGVLKNFANFTGKPPVLQTFCERLLLFFIKFTESVTKRSRKKHFPTLKKLLLSELPSFSIELGNYQISLILSRLSAVKASCMCTVAFMCHVKSSHYFKKRKELRKYFSHDSNSICIFCDSTCYLSFFRDGTYYLSFCRDSTCYVFFPS